MPRKPMRHQADKMPPKRHKQPLLLPRIRKQHQPLHQPRARLTTRQLQLLALRLLVHILQKDLALLGRREIVQLEQLVGAPKVLLLLVLEHAEEFALKVLVATAAAGGSGLCSVIVVEGDVVCCLGEVGIAALALGGGLGFFEVAASFFGALFVADELAFGFSVFGHGRGGGEGAIGIFLAVCWDWRGGEAPGDGEGQKKSCYLIAGRP
ncbi:hypothetical protein QBC34DRAFT_413957 [Podospora aff. communis PSN243]|uniref:Uncharacterized protein n=1 Tax=Podospora aff. communis PSN243 TaxID=3040156 RepID=A0AAV9G9Y4_9PEZI|nr:hypothetical protein QBC34DRAFT_413957 [Podospora aff. communis PSN243]